MLLNVLRCQLTYQGQAETNAEVWFNISLRPWKPEGSLGRTAQDGHLDSHTAPELCGTAPELLKVLKYCLCGRKLCESRGSRPGLPVPNSPYGLCGRKATLLLNSELRSCVNGEVSALGSRSLIVLMVSVDVKQHLTSNYVNVVVAIPGSSSLTVLVVSVDIK